MKTGINVSDAMTRSPIYASANDSAIKCAEMMAEKGVGSLIIKEEGKLLGIVTEKDFLTKIVAQQKKNTTPVKEIMTSVENLITISGEDDLYNAINTMSREDVRRLPVVSDGYILGLLTYKDVMKIHPDLYDIFVQKYKIRESTDKPEQRHYVEGKCQSCRSYHQLMKVKGMWKCIACRDGVTENKEL
ncbi:CBS domain-containing protein [archaeon]|jgi:signal-transduction protein with cAMP-binding, CBS, and nucleotidyltransferase domain|nr:CBS domain-containing protein [archaeon]